MAAAFGFVSYLFSGFSLITPDAPIVNLTLGVVQGRADFSRNGRQYFQYLGIPYAKPPTKELRFEPPSPLVEKWKGVLMAKSYRNPCIGFDIMTTGRSQGEENCLFLNVFTPRIIGKKMPVLVNFHGGMFTSGDAKDYGPKYFMDEDIVVVTMNYRLYIFGFLNTGDDLVRGNMGLKDQNMALRWVQEHIRKFGGDPDRVTIMGSGSGGVSVHYHILSSASAGLFHRAISMSGTVSFPWAFIKHPLTQAQTFGKRLACPTRNTSQLIRCLRSKRAKDLVLLARDLLDPLHPHHSLFAGTVEGVKREDAFLLDSPWDVLETGSFNKVPWILGVNSGEGAFKVARLLAYPEIQVEVGRKWKEYAPILAHFDPAKTEVSDQLRQYYFGGSRFLNPGFDVENLTQLISDGVSFSPSRYAALRHARHAPTHLYFLTHVPKRFPNVCTAYKAVRHDDWAPSELKSVATGGVDYAERRFFFSRAREELRQDWSGVCLDQQIPLLWNAHHQDPLIAEIWRTSPDYPFSQALIRVVVDFMENEGAKLKFSGLPWPSIGPKGPPFMYMRLDHPPRMISEPFAKHLPFWDSLGIRSGYDMGAW